MNKKKIAVVNRTNFKNYGSILQCFALCEAIKNLGFESEIIWSKGGLSTNYDIRPRKIVSSLITLIRNPSLWKELKQNINSVNSTTISTETVRLFDSFIDKYIHRCFYTNHELVKISKGNKYIAFVCGSDQIWNPHSLYLDPLLFLRFAPQNKRVAYAPSLGCNDIPKHNLKKLRKYIKDIPYVSVRERTGAVLLKELCDQEYPVVVDPTLLFNREFWHLFSTSIEKDNYVLCYFLNTPSDTVQTQIVEYASKKAKKVIILNSKLDIISKSLETYSPDCGPSEFLGYVENADYVFTDSYHGMLFSIIFGKAFASIERDYKEYDQSSRQISVLEELCLMERYGKNITEQMTSDIIYDEVYRRLEKIRNRSVEYLVNALEGIENGR